MAKASKSKSSRRKKRTLLTRESVIDAAREMIAEVGHEAVSLRPLASRLKVTAAALYMCVDDKRDLLEAVAAAEYERKVRQYESIQTKDPIARLKEISRIYVADARDNPELFKLRMMFAPFIGESMNREAAPQRGFDLAKSAVEEAMDLGLLRRENSFAVSIRIWAAVHGVGSFVLMGAETRHSVDKNLIDQVVEAMVAGLSPKPKKIMGAACSPEGGCPVDLMTFHAASTV